MTGAVAANAVDGVSDDIGDVLANDEDVRITGFGNFVTKKRAALTGRQPRTGKVMSITAFAVPAFKPGTTLKAIVRCAGSW